jgi:hypothetical protein
MKKRLLIMLCAVAGFVSLAASKPAVAGVSWSVSVFDGPLGASGHWIDRPGYGRCWYPAYVSSNWQPYCEGYWMWTNQGWYWVSSEPWAWATYHYGRWVNDPYYGWVWTPDTEWAPSWVSWREGGGYVGWAPLPPGSSFGVDGQVVFRERPVSDRFFMFVEVNHFSEPIHRSTVIINKTTVINQTVNITKITRVNNVVINHGPRVDVIQKVSSRKLTEPPQRVAATRIGGEAPKAPKPTLKEQVHERIDQEEGVNKRAPETVRSAPDRPQEPARSNTEPEKRPVNTPPQNQPQYEKHKQPRPEDGKEEKPKKGESSKEEGKEEKRKPSESGGN